MADERLEERIAIANVKYMTTEEVMALYHVTRRTIYRWNDAGRLHGLKAGRRLMFDRDEVMSLVGE